MAANTSVISVLVGSAVALGGLGLLARRRMRARKNPSGIEDANLSVEERRKAAAEAAGRRDANGAVDLETNSQEGTSG